MKPDERALLQERVRTLVLRHALEAAFSRLATVSGPGAEDELLRLEHALVATARKIADLPQMASLAAMVAVEDAVGTIRGAFDAAHARIEPAMPVAQDTPLAA